MNEDYTKGMKFLLKGAKERGINVRKCQWIPHVSRMLSERGVCYKFWYNVWRQNRLDRVPSCKTWYDVMYDSYRFLFRWDITREGYSFWSSVLSEVSGLNVFNRQLCD